ncbi:MAG TPA: TolC family outer membrane protein [Stellaceae bacterium]|nr:TolC family outer membrane protein [Stellaceae bacterium]
MTVTKTRRGTLLWCAVAALLWPHRAGAETLSEALTDTYQSNPQILAERANVRATDEGVPQALSGWRPTVTVTQSAGPQRVDSQTPFPFTPPKVGTIARVTDLNVTQPLYTGGRTVAQTAQAEKTIEAERARLVATEQTVFLSVIQAYLDVVRDQATVELSINNEQVLRKQLDATDDQFRVGSVTRTDVAQAEARLAGATAARLQSEGNLQVSRANYERAVGHPPEKLQQPSMRPTLPTTRDEAINLAATKNPNVIAAVFTEDAARDQIDVTRSQLLPTVSLVGDINRAYDTQFTAQTTTTGSLIARVTIPLYEGGAVYSQTRQAQQVVSQRFSQTDDTRRTSVQGATQAFEQVVSGRAQVISLQATITAAEIALEGVRQEATVGSRTVLDVLNAEQELFTDRVQLVTTQHDLALAEFTLAQQIGQLTAADLNLPVKLYDVDVHYRSVRDKWIGFGAKAGEEGADARR